jgi:hypothetical protein
MSYSNIEQRKDTKTVVKNLTNSEVLNFAFGGTNKVFTPQKDCSDNEKITLSQLIELIKSDAPNNALKVREITKTGFEVGTTAKEIKKQIKPFKNSLPFVLFSGFCPIHHNDNSLSYNGCLQIDIDFKFAGGDLKAIELKEVVKDLPFIVLAAISPSGYGLKCLVATDNNDVKLHSDVSKALIFELSKNLDIDIQYFDNLGASQPCFVPYDKDVFFNPNFEVYKAFKALYSLSQRELLEEKNKAINSNKIAYSNENSLQVSDSDTASEIDILNYLVSEIISTKTDVTQKHNDWISVGYSLASFGEVGRDYFHAIASLNSTYERAENDKLFNKGTTKNSNIKPFIALCSKYNITINEFCKNWILERIEAKKSEAEKNYKSTLNHYTLSDNQYILDVLKDVNFKTGLHLIKGGTGVGKTYFVGSQFNKCIVVSRNVTTLENYNKYGYTQFLMSDSKNDFIDLKASDGAKITVTYKSFELLRKTLNLDGYTIVFDEVHLLNESYKEVEQETKYCYNSINELIKTNAVIFMSANDIQYNSIVDYKSKHYFKKPSVIRNVKIVYNSNIQQLIETIQNKLGEGKKVLVYTNRKESKYISEAIKTAFQNNSIYFFDGSKHGQINLSNLAFDVTVTTSALVTGKDVETSNLSMVFYGMDRLISASTIIQFLGRARDYKTASFDILFEFENNNLKFGNYSKSNLLAGAYSIAKSTIDASVNEYSFLRENKERFVIKQDNELIVDYFNIDKFLQREISKHTILNTDVLTRFLESHNYIVTIDYLDIQDVKQEQTTIITPLELYVLELNEICNNNESEVEFQTNVLNRFAQLNRLGFNREFILDVLNLYRSKMLWQRFVNLVIVERSLSTNDKAFIKLYNDVLIALNDYLTGSQILDEIGAVSVSKAGQKTELGRLVLSVKSSKKSDKNDFRKVLKVLKNYYYFDVKQVKTKKVYKAEKSEFLQSLQLNYNDLKDLFLYSEIM